MLFLLSLGKAKSKMETVMIDKMTSINVYLQSRNGKQGKCDGGWYNISPAPKNSVAWRKKSTTIVGNKPHAVLRIGKNGKTKVPGYISKSGFCPHT